MISLLISLAVLIIGYLVYGKVTEKIFAPDDRQTPAVAINDGAAPGSAFRKIIRLENIVNGGIQTAHFSIKETNSKRIPLTGKHCDS